MAPPSGPASAAEDTLRSSHQDEGAAQLTSATATTSGTLCSACSAPTTITAPNKAAKKVANSTSKPTSQANLSVDSSENSSDESDDEALPPPADPDAPAGGKGKENGKGKGTKINVGGLFGSAEKENEAKEEEKVRERASKLEFKRLDELYVYLDILKASFLLALDPDEICDYLLV